jgi:predicted RND superfamily exporter protein
MLVNILIIFFIFLIIYQIFSVKMDYTLEGMTSDTTAQPSSQQYQPYDTNNPNNVMILAQQNAGNIQVLKQQVDSVLGLNRQVQDLSGNLSNLAEQVYNMIQTQQQLAQSSLPSSTPVITGTS